MVTNSSLASSGRWAGSGRISYNNGLIVVGVLDGLWRGGWFCAAALYRIPSGMRESKDGKSGVTTHLLPRCRTSPGRRAGGARSTSNARPRNWNSGFRLVLGPLVLRTEVLELFVGVRHFEIFVDIVLPSFESLSSTEGGVDISLIIQGGGVCLELFEELKLGSANK